MADGVSADGVSGGSEGSGADAGAVGASRRSSDYWTASQEDLRRDILGAVQPVTLTFRNLSYCVKTGLRQGTRKILHEVSGEIKPGQLTAIMGPSGAGKSSLMNILAGYTSRGVTGRLCMNGEELEPEILKMNSCYIMQDDQLQPQLSVSEAMTMAANLKLSESFPASWKRKEIARILAALGLSDAAKTRSKNLSGGQRKRLSIALEMINNPPVMFFDEPTSGLDSSSSKQCLALLKRLVQEGRTVICTIHQPSASIFESFDKLYALADGRCIYQGNVSDLVPYLSSKGFVCPSYHNPADFLLEVLSNEHGPMDHLLSQEDEASQGNTENEDTISHRSSLSSRVFRRIRRSDISEGRQPKRRTRASLFVQFMVLLHRMFLIHIRDRFLVTTRVTMHFAIGLVIGILYYNIGQDAAYVHDNFGFLYFCVMFNLFTSFTSKLLAFPSELPIVKREYFNKWYSLKAYFLATTLIDIPVQILCTFAYTFPSYLLTSQPLEMPRMTLFFIVMLAIGFVSQLVGVLTGLCLGIENGMIFGPLAIMPFLLFSGFFVSMKDSPQYFQWLFHVSYLKYGLEAIMQSMYSYDRAKLPCSAEYCHYKTPTIILQELDMLNVPYVLDILYLAVLYLLLFLTSYLVLCYKCMRY